MLTISLFIKITELVVRTQVSVYEYVAKSILFEAANRY